MVLKRNMNSVRCSKAAKIILNTVETYEFIRPETAALWFYMMNHGMSEITKRFDPCEPLPKDVAEFVDHYYTQGAKEVLRAFSYLMLICVREARHLKDKDSMSFDMEKAGFQKVLKYIGTVPDDASKAAKIFATTPPDEYVTRFVRGLSYQFHNGHYGHSYGGPAWGKVTDALVSFCAGITSGEVLNDTMYTLQHNNGSIFNKGILFAEYANSGGKKLHQPIMKILDVQRSGQIPNLMANDPIVAEFVTDDMQKRLKWMESYLGVSLSHVDWQKVIDLGGVLNWSHELEKQKMLHPDPAPIVLSKSPPPVEKPPAFDTNKLAAELEGIPASVLNSDKFYITPKQWVKKKYRPYKEQQAA
jgi:hypothetical protein